MFSTKIGILPQAAFLQAYADQAGCFTDCYYVDVPKSVSISETISAFFTTPVFRLERVLLGIFARKPSTDQDVENLASGRSTGLAFWRTERRDQTQLLLAVGDGPIRTWLMVEPANTAQAKTRIYFGSAVMPQGVSADGAPQIGLMFRAFLGFHMLYSRLLLTLARRRLLS
jgi:hypothetical protein